MWGEGGSDPVLGEIHRALAIRSHAVEYEKKKKASRWKPLFYNEIFDISLSSSPSPLRTGRGEEGGGRRRRRREEKGN